MFQTLAHHFKKRYEQYYHPRHHKRHLHIIMDLVLTFFLVASALGAGVTYFFHPYFFENPLSLHVLTPEKSFVSGAETTLTLEVENKTGTDFSNGEISFTLPESFSLKQDTSLHTEKNNITRLIVGTIHKQTKKELTLTLTPSGELGKTSHIAFLLNVENTRNQRKENSQVLFPFLFTSSVIQTTTSLPHTVVMNSPFQGGVTVINKGELDFAHLSIDIQTPKEFVFQKKLPETFSLKSHETKKFQYSGLFISSKPGEKNSVLKINDTSNNKHILQSEEKQSLTLVESPFEFHLFSEKGSLSLTPGEVKNVTFSWKNKSSLPLSRVVVGFKLEGDYIDSSSLHSLDGFQSQPFLVSWSKNQKKSLETFTPGQEEKGHITLRLKDSISVRNLPADHDFGVIIQPFAQFALPTQEKLSSSEDTISLEVNSQLTFHSSIRYYSVEGDQLGRGPLPPRVGHETRYFVFFNTHSTIHPLSQVTLTGKLEPSVAWTGVIPQGSENLSFNQENKTFSWKIPLFNSDFGSENTENGIIFEISYKPTKDDLGKTPVLISNLHVQGTDSVTGTLLEQTAPPLTTNLLDDKKAAKKEVVQE